LLFFLFKPYQYKFPLNDDWVYEYSVEYLLKNSELKLSDWCAATSLIQIICGYALCILTNTKPDLSAFGTLRVMTFFFSFIGVIFFYLILKKLKIKQTLIFIGILLFIFNPIYFVLSFTFMTDIYYIVFMLISIYFYILFFEKPKNYYLILGSIFSAAAYLERQVGILIPVGVILYMIFTKKFSFNKTVIIMFFPVFVFLLHWYWLNYIHLQPWVYQAGMAVKLDLSSFLKKFIVSIFYCGLFTIPLIFYKHKIFTKNILLNFFVLCLTFFVFLNILTGSLPYIENIIHKNGLGTITLGGIKYKSYFLLSNNNLWLVLTVLSGIIGIIIFSQILQIIKKNNVLFLLFNISFLQLIVSLMRFKFFDRYLLVILPLCIIILLTDHKDIYKTVNPGIIISLIFMIFYSVFGTKDYLEWNKAKYLAGNLLIKDGYKPEEIANGFDWDGYFTFQKNIDILKTIKPQKSIGEWEWQTMNKYKVVISFSPEESKKYNVKIIRNVEYFDFLSFKKHKIYVYG